MGVCIFFSRILLAAIFGIAGITKLFDLKGSRQAILDFGAFEWLTIPLGYGIPIVETVIAGLLVSPQTALWGELGALALLVTFLVVICINLALGKRPDCHCFGQLHSEPIGVSTLLRSGLLAVVAAGLLLAPHQEELSLSAAGSEILALHPLISVLAVSLFLLFLAQVYFTLHLFRQNGRLLLRIEALESATGTVLKAAPAQYAGLALGTPAPTFELPLLRGGTSSLEDLLQIGKPLLLVFSDAACGPCKALVPELVAWQRQHGTKFTLAVITRGVSKANPASLGDLDNVFVQNDREVAERYRVVGTPSAVLIGLNGLIGSPYAPGAQAIGSLVVAAANGTVPAGAPALPTTPRQSRAGLPVGTPAPSFTLSDVSDKAVGLADYRGHDILLLFWNPTCGFCARMLARLKDLERSRPKSAPQIVLISAGTLELNRAMGLQSAVLLDQGQGIFALFGATGTPSALVVSRDGNIGSSLAAGADAIFALLDDQKSPVANSTMGFRQIEQHAT